MFTKTHVLPIISVLIASILGAVGQFLFQYGAKHTKDGIISYLTNPYLLTGMATYLTVLVLFTYAFKIGGTVRVLYPVYASTFIWAAIIACLKYGQAIKPVHFAGMALLMFGIICMTW